MHVRKPKNFKRSHLAAAMFAALTIPVAASSFAQEGEQEADTKEANSDATTLDKVTVTGSRIARDTFNSVSPIQVITREETTLAGLNSTAGALQSTSVTAGSSQINNSYGGYVTNGGPGANTLSLRGLGATRTLVLLNGRRVSPAGSRGSVGATDLNVLPSSIVDRIEILKDGASSIYGSDAVAGVVNIITRRNLDGFLVEGQYNATADGGGDQMRSAVTWGTTGDRGYFTGSFEMYSRTNMTWGQRDWMDCQTDYRRTSNSSGVGAWGSGDFIDPRTGQPKCYTITGTGSNGVTVNTIGTGNMTGVAAPGTTATVFNRWRPNASVTTGLVGYEGVGGTGSNNNVRDTTDPRMFQASLISPAKTKTAFLQGGYDLNTLGNAEAYFETLINKRESWQDSHRQLSLDYAQGSPLIPAGLASAPISQTAPTLITNGRPLHIRAFISTGIYRSEQEVDFYRATGGLRGDLPWSDWKYDASLSHANSDASYSFPLFLTDRLSQSLDVVSNGAGGFVCRNTANGCVAAPALTPAVVGGALPKDWLDFVQAPIEGSTKYKESTVNFTVNGSLFSLPYGEARSAFGLEYRRAEIDDTPSIHMQTGNTYNFSGAAITRGKDSVWEAFGELELPLLSGVTGAEELAVNLSGRYTDYESYGSDTTYKIGLLYTPVNWLSLRSAYGTSYRAPALFEQFLGSTSGFVAASNDPCNNWASGDPESNRYRNCQSEGLPGNFQQTSSVQINTLGGAENRLSAETSKNFTAGLVLQPELSPRIGNIQFAIDYYDIEVNDGVARLGYTNLIPMCYDDVDFRNGGAYCQLVQRYPVGHARQNQLVINDSYVNLSVNKVRGFEYNLRYTRDIGPGQFRANAMVTRYLEQSSKLLPDDTLDDANGNIGAPAMTGSLNLAYRYKAWDFYYGAEWVDAMSSYDWYGQNPETSTYKMDTPDYYLHNLSVQYKGDSWSATAGVRNVADKTPPPISQGFANRMGNSPLYSGFDYFGRSFFVNFTKAFN